MRAKLTFLCLLMSCVLSSAVAAQFQLVTRDEALEIAKQEFSGRDVDYFIRDDNNSTTWTIFVDAEPMKGWEHECYVLQIPRAINVTINPTVTTRKIRRKLPPSGNFVPLLVRNRYGTNANSKPIVAKVAQSNS